MDKSISKTQFPFSQWISFVGLLTQKGYILCRLFIILLASIHSSVNAQGRECDEVLVSLQVKYIGSTELPSIICGKEVYLSVPTIFDFLQIKNTINANYSIIKGFFILSNNAFKIDETAGQITYKDQVISLKPGDLIRTTTNLFLKASYFNTVFELENNFSFRNLSVSMSSKLELPAIREARLLAMRDNIQKMKLELKADTTIVRDKPLLHFGTANWDVNTIQQSEGNHSERILLKLGGIVAGGELTTSLNYTSNQPIEAKNQFYRWRYVNNDNKYIKQLTLGKILAPSKATILFPVVGAQITNASTQIRKSFGTYILSNQTQANWTVELYINNVLIDYLQADANGFFSFNVPLMYGRTEVTLRYYGPWGEEQFFSNQYVVPALFLPKKEVEYTISSGIIEDGRGSIFTNAKVNYGLSNYITLGGGLEYISSLESNKSIPFLNSSFRLASQLFLTGSYYSKVLYELNLNYTTPKNLRFDFDYSKYDKNQQAIRFNYSEIRKVSISMPHRSSFFSGTSRFTIQQNLFRTTKFTTSEFLLSGSSHGFNFNFTTNAFFTKNQKPLVYSNISTSFQLPKRFVLVPQLRYGYDANAMTTLQTQLRKPIFKKGFIQTSLDYNFKNRNSSFQISFIHNFDHINTGFSNIFYKNSASFSQSASGSLIFEPQADFVSFNNRIRVGRASVKFVPFLDINGNGKKEPKEPLVKGVEIIVMGGDQKLVNPDGTTIITGLEPYIKNYVELNTNKINSIAWRVENKTLNCTLNPNQLKIIKIPVIVVGEVDGMVSRNENGKLIATGGLKINIYNTDHVLTTTILSEPDGYFSFLGLKSGSYSAKIDSLQLQNLQMTAEPASAPFEINNGTDGSIVDNIEFILHKENLGKSDAETIPFNNPSKALVVDTSAITTDQIEHSEQVVYRVQLLSSSIKLLLNHTWFKSKKEIVEYQHHGYYKYTWGSSTSRTEANKIKNKLRSEGYHNAFVAAFHKNKRISSQEAKAIEKKNANIQLAISSPNLQSEISDSPASVSDASRGGQSEGRPEEGLIFKTQVFASKKKMALSDTFFKDLKDVKEYLHKGLYKYTVGSSKSIEEANKNKNKLRSQGFSGAFIVPFNDNKRISNKESEGIMEKIRAILLATITQQLQPEITITDVILTQANAAKQIKNTSEEGLIFKTQILASKNKIALTDPIFKGLKGINEYIHKKWYKYTMSISKSLKKANEIKNKLRSQGFYGTFVVPFYHNKRTSNQEAEAINKKNATDLLEAAFQKLQLDQSNADTSAFDLNTQEQYGDSQEEGLIFKNQLLASKKKVALTDPIFKGLKDIHEYQHKGLYKYTMGASRTISAANNIKNTLRSQGFSAAFVVPFYNDKRINSWKINGLVLYKSKKSLGIAGISIRIYDADQTLITSTLSEADGTFIFLGLKPGAYTAKLDTSQLDKAQMITTTKFQKFSIAEDYEAADAQLKFILEAKDQHPQKADQNESSSQKGLVFRVQLIASQSRLSLSNQLFKALNGIERYQHEGLYKYTWGESKSLDSIRKIKKELQNRGFKDTYIVSFYNGKRINMQETTGAVYLGMNGTFYELGGITINIYNENDQFVTALLSKPDGRFSFLGLRKGKYTASLDQIQLDKLEMVSDNTSLKFSLDNEAYGEAAIQLKFILRQTITNPK